MSDRSAATWRGLARVRLRARLLPGPSISSDSPRRSRSPYTLLGSRAAHSRNMPCRRIRMAAPRLTLAPPDPHNLRLPANVHPAGWVNLEPAPRYNLVVIGSGTAGLVTAAGAAGLGAKVALVERDFMGGDCLNFGCVPSQAMLRAAR